jgi:hypothetical protein
MPNGGNNGNGNGNRNGNGTVNNIWRAIAVGLAGVFASSLAGFLLFGLDTVKHSEIAGILATQAPWVYDKVRVEEKIKDNTRRIDELMVMKDQLYRKETPLAKDVEQLRERVDRLQQTVWELQTEQKRNHP